MTKKEKRNSGPSSFSQCNSNKHEAFAYVRVRPVLPHIDSPAARSHEDSSFQDNEGDDDDDDDDVRRPNATELGDGSIILEGLTTETTFEQPVYAVRKGGGRGALPIVGFSGVLGTDESNARVYDAVCSPRLDTVTSGGTTSIFCYGYTGAGKTHTTLGYGDEPGLFRLAVEEIMDRVARHNQRDGKEEDDEPLSLSASVVEVYNDEAYDVLGGGTKCDLRKNSKGQLMVRGATTKRVPTNEERNELYDCADFAVVTSTISAWPVESLEDLERVQNAIAERRAVGVSSVHDRSSRSHLVVRLDVTNRSLSEAHDDLERQRSFKPALQTAYDKKRTYALRRKVAELEERIDANERRIERMYDEQRGSPFGGRFILVDLAGADSTSGDPSASSEEGEKGLTIEQKKQTIAINKSLLALKECIRGLQSSSTSRSVPFRNSSLTRLLEEVLTPKSEGRHSESVMIVNVSPSARLKSKTVNSLRYGAMFSANAKRPSRSVPARAKPSRALLEAKRRMKEQIALSETDGKSTMVVKDCI